MEPESSPSERISLRMDFDLVPDWSSIVERVARAYGKDLEIGVDGKQLVLMLSVPDKARFMGEVQRLWGVFVDQRKRDGRWKE